MANISKHLCLFRSHLPISYLPTYVTNPECIYLPIAYLYYQPSTYLPISYKPITYLPTMYLPTFYNLCIIYLLMYIAHVKSYLPMFIPISINVFFVLIFRLLRCHHFCYILNIRLLLHPSQVICKAKKVKKHYACQKKCSGGKGPLHGKEDKKWLVKKCNKNYICHWIKG